MPSPAWLLIDAEMIRMAAGRPSGKEDLGLPRLAKIEVEADPKAVLHRALRRAALETLGVALHPPAIG